MVLPGVGSFGRCMEALRRSGLDRVVHEAVASGRPFIGICVGMQMLYEGSDESPGVAGLGVLPGRVRRLPAGVKRPQMQWNRLILDQPAHPMVQGLGPDPWVYFVHSYAPPDGSGVVATCEYGGTVVAAVARDRVWATQFHPEKSGPVGLALLRNFVAAVAAAEGRRGRHPGAFGYPAVGGRRGQPVARTRAPPERTVDLYPAIDLRGGRCVRLVEGDFARETAYSDDPVAVARAFQAAGARWIHVVDLDGARTGLPVNREVVGRIAAAVGAVRRPGPGRRRGSQRRRRRGAARRGCRPGRARHRGGGAARSWWPRSPAAGPEASPSASTTATVKCAFGAGRRAAAAGSPRSCPRPSGPARPR